MITNEAFETLISLKKVFEKIDKVSLPHPQEGKIYNLFCRESKDEFIFDLSRKGTIELKQKAQLRLGKSVPIVRLEVNCPPHLNPDGTMTSRNHIHIYKENFDLKWAYDLDTIFHNISNDPQPLEIFYKFCEYCNIDTEGINLQGVI